MTRHPYLARRLWRRGFSPASLAVAACLLAAMPLVAQQGGAAPQKKPTFETQSTVVLLDIVVRDKKGNPVRDLR